ncbi:PA2169 family four-helix-bundle protein [soil metagenome]
MSNNDHAVKVLNSLIETTLDSAQGYKHAADGVTDAALKATFSERASQREDLSRTLQTAVRTLGGEPEDDQSLLGRIHNKFAEVRGEIMGRDDKGVIDEVERGEDVIKGKFEFAKDEEGLPPSVLELIESGYSRIQADHASISGLKHSIS